MEEKSSHPTQLALTHSVAGQYPGHHPREGWSNYHQNHETQRKQSLTPFLDSIPHTPQLDMESNGGLVASTGPPPEQDIPLQIPKSVALSPFSVTSPLGKPNFLSSKRSERENRSCPPCLLASRIPLQSTEIHKAFQRDLCKMRLETARAYVKTLTTDGLAPTVSLPSSSLPLSSRRKGL